MPGHRSQAAWPSDPFEQGRRNLVVLMGYICWLVVGRLLRLLSATAQRVSQLGPQNLGHRIRMTVATEELKELADALDSALDRLAVGYQSQRRFASNASHELRTPLAMQRLLTKLAIDSPKASRDVLPLGAQLLRTTSATRN